MAYFRQLHDTAEYVANHQAAVRTRVDLAEGTDLSMYPVGEHYLVYVPVDKKQIAVVALIRQTRDVPAILQTNSVCIRRALSAALKS